jgi:hypothetical protein
MASLSGVMKAMLGKEAETWRSALKSEERKFGQRLGGSAFSFPVGKGARLGIRFPCQGSSDSRSPQYQGTKKPSPTGRSSVSPRRASLQAIVNLVAITLIQCRLPPTLGYLEAHIFLLPDHSSRHCSEIFGPLAPCV